MRAYNEAGVGVSDSARATPEVPPCPRLIIDAISGRDRERRMRVRLAEGARARGGCGSDNNYSMSGAPSGVTIESGDGRTGKTISSSGARTVRRILTTVTVTAT